MSDQTPSSGRQPTSQAYQSPPGYIIAADSKTDEISLLDILRALNRHRWTVIVITGLVTLLSVAAALLITPVYRAEVLVMPVSGESVGGLSSLANQFGGLTSLMGINLSGDQGNSAEAVATLKSRAFAIQFLKEEDLLPIIFNDKWDSEHERWKTENQADIPTLQDGFRSFDKIRTVSVDNSTGLVTLTIDWTDPSFAASWANLMVEHVNQLLRQRAIWQAEKSLSYLRKEVEKTDVVELQQAIYRLIENSINEIMLANVRDEYAFRVVDPAVVVEEEDRIWPQRKLIVAVGFLIGGLIGCFVALTRDFLQSQVPKLD